MDSNVHKGHRERLRSRFLECGAESFSDVELLELLLFYAIPRADTNVIAHRLLERFGSFRGVMEAPVSELQAVEGVGENASLLLSLSRALMQRYEKVPKNRKKQIVSVANAGEFFIGEFYGKTEEAIAVLCLNADSRVIRSHVFGGGMADKVRISMRDLVAAALSDNAARVILAHNHVDCPCVPSEADLAATRQARDALAAIGVELLDHIIVSDRAYLSLRDCGQMPD